MILGVQTFSLDAFTKQIMLNEKNMWATLEYVVKEVSKQEDGNYVMLKDPVKGILHLYAVSEEDMKNNNFRLSKWGVQAMLAGVDRVKIGFVSRRNMNNL